jgi:hypothetical protein
VGKSQGSTETEQIKSGPLCGLSRPTDFEKRPELTEIIVEINDLRDLNRTPPVRLGQSLAEEKAETLLPQRNTENTKKNPLSLCPSCPPKPVH